MNSRKDLYGFSESRKQIIKKYPLEKGVFVKEDFEKPNYTITYNIYTAYSMRKRNIPVVVWGRKYKNHRAFVFRKQRMEEFEL